MPAKVPYSNGHVAYDVVGSGPPLVWLHGFLENRGMWQEILPHFPENTCICIDLPGHGETSVSAPIFPMEYMAGAVQAVLHELGVAKPLLIGHSMGGYVALTLAEIIPVSGIVLAHSTCLPDGEEKKRNRDRVAGIVAQNKFIFIREAIPALFHQQTDNVNALVAGMIDQAMLMSEDKIIASLIGMRDRSGKCTVMSTTPSVIISGKYDSAIDPFALEHAVAGFGVSVHWLLDSGHMGMFEQPAEFIQAIAGFIDGKASRDGDKF
jgi:pimeloyl-ACP methyl ester carboxylesterase